jgi:hypothetical protein
MAKCTICEREIDKGTVIRLGTEQVCSECHRYFWEWIIGEYKKGGL